MRSKQSQIYLTYFPVRSKQSHIYLTCFSVRGNYSYYSQILSKCNKVNAYCEKCISLESSIVQACILYIISRHLNINHNRIKILELFAEQSSALL